MMRDMEKKSMSGKGCFSLFDETPRLETRFRMQGFFYKEGVFSSTCIAAFFILYLSLTVLKPKQESCIGPDDPFSQNLRLLFAFTSIVIAISTAFDVSNCCFLVEHATFSFLEFKRKLYLCCSFYLWYSEF